MICGINDNQEILKILILNNSDFTAITYKYINTLGDRLTDERIQVAQQAMSNADNGLERLEGFISKIEDFHRLMNLLEVRYS